MYQNSKFLNVVFTLGLNDLLQEKNIKHIKTMSLHPGIVETGFGSGNCLTHCFRCLLCCIKKDEVSGADTTVHLCRASFSELLSGEYYDDDTRHK